MIWDRIVPMSLCVLVPLWMFWGAFRTAKGDLAEKHWGKTQDNLLNKWFLAGMSKETYIKQQRLVAWYLMPFLIVLLCLMIWATIDHPDDFSLKKMQAIQTAKSTPGGSLP